MEFRSYWCQRTKESKWHFLIFFVLEQCVFFFALQWLDRSLCLRRAGYCFKKDVHCLEFSGNARASFQMFKSRKCLASQQSISLFTVFFIGGEQNHCPCIDSVWFIIVEAYIHRPLQLFMRRMELALYRRLVRMDLCALSKATMTLLCFTLMCQNMCFALPGSLLHLWTVTNVPREK